MENMKNVNINHHHMNLSKDIEEKSLYDPSFEHDSCGIGFVANLKGKKSHDIVEDAITMLVNMEHRGGCGCEPDTGDGAGILIQMPHDFFAEECKKIGFELPAFGEYAVGMVFFPSDVDRREECRAFLNDCIKDLGFELLGYREVPTNNAGIGPTALSVEQKVEQVFIRQVDYKDPDALERRLFVLRNYTTHHIRDHVQGTEEDFYIPTLSHKIIVYKGQLRTTQLRKYYPDLQDERLVSGLALIHSRFSTNTFPSWKLAQPFRFIAHNGEINTIRGNVNWMKSKEALLESTLFTPEEIEILLPICDASHSDSANLDNIVEMLTLGGRSLPHVMMMLIPEAWQDNDTMEEHKKAFYEYHATLMEPWDGPASICFTDGKIVGATLDRNGLRPSRYCLTDDDKLIMSSEAGALPVDPSTVVLKGRLKPGRMFVADLEQGKIISDEELKQDICTRQPYRQWLNENHIKMEELPAKEPRNYSFEERVLIKKQLAVGYTTEDLRVVLGPMSDLAKEPIGSMGADTPLAVLSHQTQHLSNYFKQLFAQVSNPPIDPIRERLVMSLFSNVGTFCNILEEKPEYCKQIHLSQPVLTDENLEKLRKIEHPDFKAKTIHATFNPDGKEGRMEEAIDKICLKAERHLREGYNILIISHRRVSEDRAAIPSLMATGAIHHHLINKNLRAKAALVVEGADVVETHHFATLIGYGASAVNPYLAFETIAEISKEENIYNSTEGKQAIDNYIHAIGYGLLKVFSKMGISTLQSYHGAQIFEALGISNKVVDRCFSGTVSRIGGLSFDGLAREALIKHRLAYPEKPLPKQRLQEGGFYQWKRRGEYHLFNPDTVHLLQQSTRTNNYAVYKEYANLINEQTRKAATLRGLFEFRKTREPVPLEEVEPKENIFKRFATGAMSFGSISHEAHSTLAIAMNRIGGKSNSGEGGEDEVRFERKPNGDWENSAIKQVASGRFGVTSHYLSTAQELQIKMAQGAKPGEGGQLPGHKVDEWIGRVRRSTPGVGLISPPPHHDIYSIEDLAQLIFDLKNANREARINVKLVSEAGVGTIAAGVAKAKADVVLIAGYDGGTGASPISSIRHAGLPWELGVAESHQTLVKNNLRSRIVLQADGQMKTGRDLVIAALLGAEEWGVSTAALIVEGCIMLRKCHLNTCSVGVATQDPELRKMFTGNPDHVVNLFTFLAEDMREIMAELGFRTVDEMIGQADMLKAKDSLEHWKMKDIDLYKVLFKEPAPEGVGIYKQMEQDHELEGIIDWELIKAAQPALEYGENVKAEFGMLNINRSVGTMLSNEISKRYGSPGLPEGTVNFKFKGSAGQSFGAFGAPGIRFELEGEANDYFGKGLSGGQLIIYPDSSSKFRARDNMIIGNVAFYGAISGEAYIRGHAGERFCVRNSGVKAVVEGVGDHACEYMTGGVAVILGETGRNFAAGMSGGVAYVYDPDKKFGKYCNMELVDFDPFDQEDIDRLKELIENHFNFTGSGTAKRILKNWDEALKSFVKVMPREYKAALQRLAAVNERLDLEETA
jgi:glutamate synthase (NADPH/NADH) large chain